MNDDLKTTIIKTLTYFDIFDYPLTLSEVRKYNEKKTNLTDNALLDVILSIPIIQESNGLFYLLGRSEIVAKRQEKNELSSQKFGKAQVLAKFLSQIPTIEYIGVVGNLSMNNSSMADDIELFIIARMHSLWITNLWVNFILKISKQYENRKDSNAGNKVVVRIMIDKNRLLFPKKKRNLYYAHEIANLRTLFTKNESEVNFLNFNKWILDSLPNISLPLSKKRKVIKGRSVFLTKIINNLIYKIAQKSFSKTAIEARTASFAIFEKLNKEKVVLDLYEIKLKKYLTLHEEDRWIESEEARYYLDEKKVRILN